MKKFIPYIIIILVLGVAIVGYRMYNNPASVNKREGDFAVKDKSSITKIVLEDTYKNKVELKLVSGVWMINNKYAVRDELINQLLDVVTRIESLTPLQKVAHDNVMREMLAKNIKAEIYTSSDTKPEKSYWVGGPTPDNENTYMLLEVDGQAASRPHIVILPGHRGYVTAVYNTDETNWRTRTIFNYKPEEIQMLMVEYPDDEKSSFGILQAAPDSFVVGPLNEKYRINESYQQKYVKQYLEFYSSIAVETYNNDNPLKDSIQHTKPYCVFTIVEKDSSTNRVKLFRMPYNKRSKSQYDSQGREIDYDIDRFYASVHNDADLAIAQYHVFGKVLRSYKDFYFKPTE